MSHAGNLLLYVLVQNMEIACPIRFGGMFVNIRSHQTNVLQITTVKVVIVLLAVTATATLTAAATAIPTAAATATPTAVLNSHPTAKPEVAYMAIMIQGQKAAFLHGINFMRIAVVQVVSVLILLTSMRI